MHSLHISRSDNICKIWIQTNYRIAEKYYFPLLLGCGFSNILLIVFAFAFGSAFGSGWGSKNKSIKHMLFNLQNWPSAPLWPLVRTGDSNSTSRTGIGPWSKFSTFVHVHTPHEGSQIGLPCSLSFKGSLNRKFSQENSRQWMKLRHFTSEPCGVLNNLILFLSYLYLYYFIILMTYHLALTQTVSMNAKTTNSWVFIFVV